MTRDRFNPYYSSRNTFYLSSPNLLTFYEATRLILKHSLSYLSCDSIFETPPKKYFGHSTICDYVSILRFRYMLRSNPERSGGRDPSN